MENIINIYEAKAQFSKLIMSVQNTGKPITICRNNKPVADIIPHKKTKNPLIQNPLLKGAKFSCDPCEMVSEEDWPKELR